MSHSIIITNNFAFQYEIAFDGAQGTVTVVYYGVLEKIFVCALDNDPFWRHLRCKTLLLALIQPFKTNGIDAATRTVLYKPSKSPASVVTDLRNVISCIGRVETRHKWGIVDRDIRLVRPTFAEGEVDESEESDVED
jgi:hypothetical protein